MRGARAVHVDGDAHRHAATAVLACHARVELLREVRRERAHRSHQLGLAGLGNSRDRPTGLGIGEAAFAQMQRPAIVQGQRVPALRFGEQ